MQKRGLKDQQMEDYSQLGSALREVAVDTHTHTRAADSLLADLQWQQILS